MALSRNEVYSQDCHLNVENDDALFEPCQSSQASTSQVCEIHGVTHQTLDIPKCQMTGVSILPSHRRVRVVFYAYIYIYIHVHIYIFMCIYIYIHTYINVYIYIY